MPQPHKIDAALILDRCTPEPNTGCWLWTGRSTGKGYGVIGARGKECKAYRLSFELFNGPIPAGLCVCHSCDTRLCVNPEHLFLGTYADNNRDRDAKGRCAHGPRNGLAKLTPEQVNEIRASNKTLRQLARSFGVHHTVVLRAKQGVTWARA